MPNKKRAKQKEAKKEVGTINQACAEDAATSEYKIDELITYIEPVTSEIKKAIKRGDSESLSALYCAIGAIDRLYSELCYIKDALNLNDYIKDNSPVPEEDEDGEDDGVPEQFLEKIDKQKEKELKKRKELKAVEEYAKADYCR